MSGCAASLITSRYPRPIAQPARLIPSLLWGGGAVLHSDLWRISLEGGNRSRNAFLLLSLRDREQMAIHKAESSTVKEPSSQPRPEMTESGEDNLHQGVLPAPFARWVSESGLIGKERAQLIERVQKLIRDHRGQTPASIWTRITREGLVPAGTSYCAHGVRFGRCRVCCPSASTFIYISAGGTHFHSTPTCRSLESGQLKVERRGGEVSEIEAVNPYDGRLTERDPCRSCGVRRPTPRGGVGAAQTPSTKKASRWTRCERCKSFVSVGKANCTSCSAEM